MAITKSRRKSKAKPLPTIWPIGYLLWELIEPNRFKVWYKKPTRRKFANRWKMLNGIIFRPRNCTTREESPKQLRPKAAVHNWFQRWFAGGVITQIGSWQAPSELRVSSRLAYTDSESTLSPFHVNGAANCARRPTRNRSRHAGNLTVAWILTMGGLLIYAVSERRLDGAPMSVEGFVERCLFTQMKKAYCNAELKHVPETQKQHALNEFKGGPIYNKILHQAEHFERERFLVEIGANDVEEETKLIYFLIDRKLEVRDSSFIENLHNTPEGRWILEELPKGAISADKSSMVVSYAQLMAHFNCFRGLEDTHKTRELNEGPEIMDKVCDTERVQRGVRPKGEQ